MAHLYQTQIYKGSNLPNLFLHDVTYTKQNICDNVCPSVCRSFGLNNIGLSEVFQKLS